MSAILHIQLLGGFLIAYAGAPVTTIRSGRRQALLAYLLLHRDAPLARARLAFLFWPDSTEAQARTNLRKHLHFLRRSLPDADRYIHLDTHTVQWLPDAPFTLDVADLEATMATAEQSRREGRQVAERAALERATHLYKGDLLPSCYDDWILPQRERLRQAYIRALERLVALCEDRRDYAAAVDHAQGLLRHDPLYEAAYRHLMRLYALADDRANALQTYHTCETVLQRELGVSPSPATQDLYARLMRATPATSEQSPAAPAPPSPMVGRDLEWAQLQSAWRAATRHGPQMVLVKGDSGIGKTRLVEEMMYWAHKQGVDAALARCYAAEDNLAFAPVVTWLRARPLPSLDAVWRRELARLLPEAIAETEDIVPPYPMMEPWQRQLLFEALARAILGHGAPLLLALDDIQWCDHETLAWLQYLVRFPEARLLVLVTLNRTATLNAPEHLNLLLRALDHDDQLTEVLLGALDRASTAQMAANLSGCELAPDLAAHLYRETEGNPLFVSEIVHAGLDIVEAHLGDASRPLPPRMQATIEARLARLSPDARGLAGLAAAIGRQFAFAVLAQASTEGQDTLVRELDELCEKHVIREHGQDGYDFTHDKLREVAYAGLSAARRRLHHLRIAQALEALYPDELSSLSAQLALHYDRAAQPRQAIGYYRRAALTARGIFANRETIRCLERALALTERLRPGREGQRERLDILLNLTRTCFADGQAKTAERYLREAIALGHDVPLAPHRLVRMTYWLGEILHWQGRYDEQIRTGERGLALLEGDTGKTEAKLMQKLIAIGRGTAPNTVRLPDPARDRPDGTLLERRLWYAVFETQRVFEINTQR
jgi:DNA-binding SARP family transcriptional activator